MIGFTGIVASTLVAVCIQGLFGAILEGRYTKGFGENLAIQGSILNSFDNILSNARCAGKCTNHKNCLSYNYHKVQRKCQINSSSSKHVAPIAAPGYKYFDRTPDVAGSDRKHAIKDCKDLLNTFPVSRSGTYWLDPNGEDVNDAFQGYCDMETDGGGWTLVHAYTVTNFASYGTSSNNQTPRPNWSRTGTEPISTTAPTSETDFNAMDFQLWSVIGRDFLFKSNLNHWVSCKPDVGSLVDWVSGSINCRNIKDVSSSCLGSKPTTFEIRSNGWGCRLAGGVNTGTFIYMEGFSRGGWPTHDPCSTGSPTPGVTNPIGIPHGDVYIR